LTIEYYSRKADEVLYRGHQGVLFKRDFAGELMDKFGSGLKLIDYGFVYHRDTFPQDDLTWFLLEKTHP
jgi:spore coat polysaccharide biosynthesis protein SpsF